MLNAIYLHNTDIAFLGESVLLLRERGVEGKLKGS